MSLQFDAQTHTYTWAGRVVPGVTRILEAAGLREMPGVSREVMEKKRELGTLVHEATELDARGELDESSIDPEVVPYLKAFRRFVYEVKPEILSCEEQVYHHQYRFAGTLDHRMVIHGEPAVVDKKTGIESMTDAVQLSAYREAKYHDRPEEGRRQKMYVLSLRADGNYKLRAYEDHFHVFLAALTCYRFNNGG